MIDFSINFANDVLIPADFSCRKNFGHEGFVLEKWEIRLLLNVTF